MTKTLNSLASALALFAVLGGCSAAPDKVLETSSIKTHKKPRAVDVTEHAPSKPSLAQTCAQRHIDFQAGRNQPQTLDQKHAMDAACASVQ